MAAWLTVTDNGFTRAIQDEIGIKPTWSPEVFGDLDEDVRNSLRRIERSPFITRTSTTGSVNSVVLAGYPVVVSTARFSRVRRWRHSGCHTRLGIITTLARGHRSRAAREGASTRSAKHARGLRFADYGIL